MEINKAPGFWICRVEPCKVEDFYYSVDVATSAQVDVDLLVSPNIAECVVDWVPLEGRVCLLQVSYRSDFCVSCKCTHLTWNHITKPLWRKLRLFKKKKINRVSSVFGDFNAHVDIDNATWKGVVGQHGDLDNNKTKSVYCSMWTTHNEHIFSAQKNS